MEFIEILVWRNWGIKPNKKQKTKNKKNQKNKEKKQKKPKNKEKKTLRVKNFHVWSQTRFRDVLSGFYVTIHENVKFFSKIAS